MKYAVICDPETPQALASSTLFDLLGDPSTWKEHHEVRFIGDPDGTDKSWAGLVVEAGDFTVQEDFSGLDATWVILGPTEEELVVEGTATGAKYLALDEGLTELTVVDEPAEEAPVVPDVDVQESTPTEEPANEVPATPKRRTSRKKAEPAPAKVEKPKAEAEVETPKIDTTKPLTVESVRAASEVLRDQDLRGQDLYAEADQAARREAARQAKLQAAFNAEAEDFGVSDKIVHAEDFGQMNTFLPSRQVPNVLRELIGVLIEGADEDQLWQIAAAIRGLVK